MEKIINCNKERHIEETTRYKILLVEDNVIVQLAQSTVLKKFQCNVDIASNGENEEKIPLLYLLADFPSPQEATLFTPCF